MFAGNDHIKYTMLCDIYGQLLTKKQRQIIEYYYMEDMSLSEIGELLGITRQAASILINRTEKHLLNYESKLNLLERHTESKEKIEGIIQRLVKHGIDDDDSLIAEIKSLL